MWAIQMGITRVSVYRLYSYLLCNFVIYYIWLAGHSPLVQPHSHGGGDYSSLAANSAGVRLMSAARCKPAVPMPRKSTSCAIGGNNPTSTAA